MRERFGVVLGFCAIGDEGAKVHVAGGRVHAVWDLLRHSELDLLFCKYSLLFLSSVGRSVGRKCWEGLPEAVIWGWPVISA